MVLLIQQNVSLIALRQSDTQMNIGLRLGLGLLICMLFGLAYEATTRVFFDFGNPSFQYRVLGNSSKLREVKRRQLFRGMDVDKVERFLGAPVHIKSQRWIEIQMLSAEEPWFDSVYPDGIKSSDLFVAYEDGYTLSNLQFRDGKLLLESKKSNDEEKAEGATH